MARVVVIGGGVVGLSCAYYLLKDGHSVTVLDRDGCTKGSSWGNAGMIVPSHFEPMANPGMLALGLKIASDRGGPLGFAMKGEVAKWSMAFARSATKKHVERTQQTILDLNRHSRHCYFELFGAGVDGAGLLMVCESQAGLSAEAELAGAAMKLGVNVEFMGAQDLKDLGFRGAGAIWFKEDAFFTAADFMPWLRDQVTGLGGQIDAATVEKLQTASGRVQGALTSRGKIEGDEFILAAGAWSGKLGPKLLITAGRGYGFTVSDPPVRTSVCAILVEARVATTPVSGGQRFTGVMELGQWGSDFNPTRLERVRSAIPRYLPAFAGHDFNEDVWVGHRPCSFDGVPFIGRFARLPNLIAATGHGMMGMSLGPGTGRLVSDIVAGKEPQIDLTICSPDR